MSLASSDSTFSLPRSKQPFCFIKRSICFFLPRSCGFSEVSGVRTVAQKISLKVSQKDSCQGSKGRPRLTPYKISSEWASGLKVKSRSRECSRVKYKHTRTHTHPCMQEGMDACIQAHTQPCINSCDHALGSSYMAPQKLKKKSKQFINV